jgi:hypothetical protein
MSGTTVKGGKGLLRAALKYLRKADVQRAKRAANHRLEPHQLRHMMQGNANSSDYQGVRSGHGKHGSRTGYHYRPGGKDFPGRRIIPPPGKTHPSGAYDVRTQFEVDQSKGRDGSKMVWMDKKGSTGTSTFFPDHWTPQQIDGAVGDAFKNATFDSEKGTWWGVVGQHKLKIAGRYDPTTNSIVTAYPVID